MNDVFLKILHVDLSTKEFWEEKLDIDTWKKYLPSRGINAKLLWELTDENTDPLGKENVLIFGAGAFSGTTVPCAGRVTVTFKSPATGMYFKSNAGGHWGPELKKAGYNNLVVHGKADSPTYIFIKNNRVEFFEAEQVWGENVRSANNIIKEELNDKDIQLATIGPAGENLVKISALMLTTYNAAARGGIGAVMGSKNLKAVAVKGNNKIKVKNSDQFHETSIKAEEEILNFPGSEGLSKYGTAGTVMPLNESYSWPTKNYRESYFEEADKISGEEIVESGRLKRRIACHGCVLACHRYTESEGEEYESYGGGPELETLGSLGAGPKVSDLDAIQKANQLCNLYGIDTISAGVVIQWAMECYEKEVLPEKFMNNYDLDWGNEEAVIELVEDIAFREGLGDILAEGVKEAAKEIGQDSEKWAVEAKGLEQSGVDTRMAKAYALAFAVNPRGPDHLHTQPFAEWGFGEESRELIKEITGEEEFIEKTDITKKAEVVRWHEDVYAISDSLGICTFTNTALLGFKPQRMLELWNLVSDEEISLDEFYNIGKRIVTLEKAYNVRCGATREDDTLPQRIMNESAKDNPGEKDIVTSEKQLNEMLDNYYDLHGWDKNTGRPTKQIYNELGLDFVAEELESKNKLP